MWIRQTGNIRSFLFHLDLNIEEHWTRKVRSIAYCNYLKLHTNWSRSIKSVILRKSLVNRAYLKKREFKSAVWPNGYWKKLVVEYPSFL